MISVILPISIIVIRFGVMLPLILPLLPIVMIYGIIWKWP